MTGTPSGPASGSLGTGVPEDMPSRHPVKCKLVVLAGVTSTALPLAPGAGVGVGVDAAAGLEGPASGPASDSSPKSGNDSASAC